MKKKPILKKKQCGCVLEKVPRPLRGRGHRRGYWRHKVFCSVHKQSLSDMMAGFAMGIIVTSFWIDKYGKKES